PEEPTTGQPEEPTTGQPEEPTTGQPEEPTTGQPEEPTTGGEDIDDTADYDRVSVHDPSIVKDPDTGMYYIFGSHMAWAKSDDLINWTTFTNNINTDYLTLFAKEAEWSALGSASYDLSGNLWAPDVIWNEEMGKWCMYMSVNGDNWYTSIVLLTSDSLEGDWEYVGPVVYSGFTNAEEAAKTDLAKVIGTNEVPARYLENRNGNHTYGMNAIDPCVKYDEDGNLWMTYGSWFGGIYMLKLDSSTGLRDYTYTYETVANESDEYQGLKIAGGNHVSGEASYIEKIGDYYYLFMSYGGLVANGGYSMRVFRSESMTGPYTDPSGNDARYIAGSNTGAGNINGDVGVKLMTYYQWSYMKYGQVAQGHNSALVDDDGKAYVVYHTRTNDGTEGHQVRVHQLFTNQDGWLVAAPYEYTGETLSETGYSADEVTGTYDILIHKQSINYGQLECVTPEEITLNADGTVSGSYTGTWTMDEGSPYVTIAIGGVEYKGVFIKQYMEDTKYETMCFTLLGDNEVELWGSMHLSGKDAVDLSISAGIVTVPTSTISDISFVKAGLFGTTVSYESDNQAVLTNEGKVTRQTENINVNVKVTYSNGDYQYSENRVIAVIGSGEAGDRILVGSYYTDSPITLSNASEGTYQVPNPFNKSVTSGLQIYNGVSIEFDVEGTGDRLSNIISFNDTSGKLYFTGGSYLGYNATGGYFDANLNTGYVAGTDFINGKAHIRIDIEGSGYKVYSNGELAYSSEDVAQGKIPGDVGTLTNYANILLWLNNTAETLNFGWGNWWSDLKFNGTISNVMLYANAVETVDTSEYVYYEDFSDGDISSFISANAASALTIANDGDEKGNYLLFAVGSDGGNRGAYTEFEESARVSGKYTITLETALTAGILTQRSESVIAILGTDAQNYNANSAVSSGYILKLKNVPPEGGAANLADPSRQTKWEINDSGTEIDIPVGEWVAITADVDTNAKTAAVTITKKSDGTEIYSGTVNINGTGELLGIQLLRGRGVGTVSLDTVTVKSVEDESGGNEDTTKAPTTATAQVEGTAYPDKDSNITVKFTADENVSSSQTVKINGTSVSNGTTVGMMKVNSISYSEKICTVNLTMSAISGWHEVTGSYDIEFMNGTTSLAKTNVEYALEMSQDTDYTQIATISENQYTKGYYKVDGTDMYVMTIIKSDKIHCDGIAVGSTTYGWYNGIASEAYVTIDGTKYNLGIHVYNGLYANAVTWNSDATLVNSSDSVRSYMALGTFDDDSDTDKGCILLMKVDLTDIGLTEDTIKGKSVTFAGFFGPNDFDTNGDGTRFIGIDETKQYTLK
ncbi:MAG: lipocalin-like domain-containing protein, partial [Lachnospiraceae bacterium]